MTTIYATIGSTRGLAVPYEGKTEFVADQDGAITRPMGGQTYKVGGRKAPRMIKFDAVKLTETMISAPAERCEVCHSPHPITKVDGMTVCDTLDVPEATLNLLHAGMARRADGRVTEHGHTVRTTLHGDALIPRKIKSSSPVKVEKSAKVAEENLAITEVLRANGIAGKGTGPQREAVREYLETVRMRAEYLAR